MIFVFSPAPLRDMGHYHHTANGYALSMLMYNIFVHFLSLLIVENWGLVYNNSTMKDTRNLMDEFKGMSNERVKAELNARRNDFEIAIENVEHDFNIGTIVRNANAFNVSILHIVGRRKYNRRGAMCTDKYLEIKHWADTKEFFADQKERDREVIAIENNVKGALPLSGKRFLKKTTMIFGSEGQGLSEEIMSRSDEIRYIESFGSTRSVNVGVASGIAMYEWIKQNVLN
jgi:tRNA G18 (ribose-2'-O)-methylase SpoU